MRLAIFALICCAAASSSAQVSRPRGEGIPLATVCNVSSDDNEMHCERQTHGTDEAFRSDFEAIARPSDAQNFLSNYREQPDPDGLLKKATARGYSEGVKTARICIERANSMIAQQKAIAAEVGFVDKAVMYRAGQALVTCKQNLAEWSKHVKKY